MTSPRPFLEPNIAPIWSKKSIPDPTAPEDRTNVSMTTMPRMAMTALPVRLRTLNVSKGLKAMSDPRFRTSSWAAGRGPGLTLRAAGDYLEGMPGRPERTIVATGEGGATPTVLARDGPTPYYGAGARGFRNGPGLVALVGGVEVLRAPP